MQLHCVKGLDEVGKVKEFGTTSPEAVAIQHTNGVLDIHKSCLAIAEEKVFLAVQTYDLVSILICLLGYFFGVSIVYMSSWCYIVYMCYVCVISFKCDL